MPSVSIQYFACCVFRGLLISSVVYIEGGCEMFLYCIVHVKQSRAIVYKFIYYYCFARVRKWSKHLQSMLSILLMYSTQFDSKKSQSTQIKTVPPSQNRANIRSLFIHEKFMILMAVQRYRAKCCFSSKVPIDMKTSISPLSVSCVWHFFATYFLCKFIYKNITKYVIIIF